MIQGVHAYACTTFARACMISWCFNKDNSDAPLLIVVSSQR